MGAVVLDTPRSGVEKRIRYPPPRRRGVWCWTPHGVGWRRELGPPARDGQEARWTPPRGRGLVDGGSWTLRPKDGGIFVMPWQLLRGAQFYFHSTFSIPSFLNLHNSNYHYDKGTHYFFFCSLSPFDLLPEFSGLSRNRWWRNKICSRSNLLEAISSWIFWSRAAR